MVVRFVFAVLGVIFLTFGLTKTIFRIIWIQVLEARVRTWDDRMGPRYVGNSNLTEFPRLLPQEALIFFAVSLCFRLLLAMVQRPLERGFFSAVHQYG